MDEPFRSLIDELQSLATEGERPDADPEKKLTGAVSEAQPTKPPAIPLPRNVRGRRY